MQRQRHVRILAAMVALVGALAVLSPAAPALAAPVRMGGISIGTNSDGRLEAFSLGRNGIVYHNYQRPSGGWSGWSSLNAPAGGLVAGPSVARNADGRLEIFAVSTSAVYHAWQRSGGGWSGWDRLGSFSYPSGVGVGVNLDGRLEAFITSGGEAWAIWQTQAGGGWSGWLNHGFVPNNPMSGTPTVARNADGRLEVAVTTTVNTLFHKWQLPGGGWSGWSGFGACGGAGTRSVVLTPNQDGRLELLATSPSFGEFRANLCHRWQVMPNGDWSGWENLNGELVGQAPFAVSRNADGRIEVLGVDERGTLKQIWQTQPNGGWSGWWQREGGFDNTVGLAANSDGRLEAFAFRDGEPYHSWQGGPGGAWSAWTRLEAG
jgi:hypothetical protein